MYREYVVYAELRNILALMQWFLTLLEVLDPTPTSSIHAFIEPFVVEKKNAYREFFTFNAQNLLPPNS